MTSGGISGNFFIVGRDGIPDHLIQELGRRKSNAYQCYISTPSTALVYLSQKLS